VLCVQKLVGKVLEREEGYDLSPARPEGRCPGIVYVEVARNLSPKIVITVHENGKVLSQHDIVIKDYQP
jgi:hypothetical protein